MLSRNGGNIERVHRLSDGDLSALELIVSMPGVADVEAHARTLRHVLLQEAGMRFDIAVQREDLSRRAKRLVAMDMDSTLIQCEVIDELARRHGVGDEVAAITSRAMHGELDFEASLRARVALLAGLPERHLAELAAELPLTPGAVALVTALRRLGYRTALISGGFQFAAQALKHRLGLDYAYANQLERAGGALTGRVLDPVVTPARKADLLDLVAQGEGIDLAQTIAIGDGANDLPMLDRAGLGIAFHAKPSLQAAADTAVSHGGLDRVLYLLGLRARDVAELLA
jgi:phosphoserine phosphatase